MRSRLSIPLVLILAIGCAQGGAGGTRRPGPDSGIRIGPDAGGMADAGGTVDGGALVDAGPPKECDTDAECDDALVCNGAERCDADGFCANTPHAGCDDSVPCTVDTCMEPAGDCSHTADDSLCATDQTCDTAMGCVTPPPCLGDAECDDGLACNGAETCDPAIGCRSGTPPSCDDGLACTADACEEPAGTCTHVGTDADGDGYVAAGCGAGADCNDGASGVHPGAAEICDGVDNDCSGSPDDGGGLACALGSPAMSCTTTCSTAGTRPCTTSCAWGACAAATETCGNSCDDDGDGMVDEGCAAPPPPNDQCTGAILLSGSGTRTTDTLVSATAQSTDCGSGVEVFYRVSVSRRSILYLDTFGTGFDTRISYRGTSCPGAASSCTDDSCGTLQTQVAVVVNAGTHYFAVHTYSSFTTPGPLALRYQAVDAAAGDNTLITSGGTFSGSTSGASAVSATCAGSALSPEDCFYWMQCASDVRSVSATTCAAGTFYDTALHLHGTTQIACNDDDFVCFWDTLQSTLSGTTSGAGVFRLFVDGYSSSSSGSYSVSISW